MRVGGREQFPGRKYFMCKDSKKRDHVAGGTESCSVWLQLTVGCCDRDVLVNHWRFNTEECKGVWFAFYKELQLEEGSLVLSLWSMVWLWNNLYELKPKRKTDIILKVFKWGKLNERTLLRTGWGPHSLLGAERREDKYPDLSHFLPADLLLVKPEGKGTWEMQPIEDDLTQYLALVGIQ